MERSYDVPNKAFLMAPYLLVRQLIENAEHHVLVTDRRLFCAVQWTPPFGGIPATGPGTKK